MYAGCPFTSPGPKSHRSRQGTGGRSRVSSSVFSCTQTKQCVCTVVIGEAGVGAATKFFCSNRARSSVDEPGTDLLQEQELVGHVPDQFATRITSAERS